MTDDREFQKVDINVPETEITLIKASELFTKSLPIGLVFRNPKSTSSSKHAMNCEDVTLTFIKAFKPEDHTFNPDKSIIFPLERMPHLVNESMVAFAVKKNILDSLKGLLDPHPNVWIRWSTFTGLQPDLSLVDSENKFRLLIECKRWNAFMTWNPNDETEALKQALKDCSDQIYELIDSDSPMQLSQRFPKLKGANSPAIMNFWHGMQQLVTYMLEYNRQTMYGILTSYVHSYFAILHRDENGNKVTVSRAVMYNDTNVMKHMFTFVKLALKTSIVAGGFTRRAVILHDVTERSSAEPAFVVTGILGQGMSGTVLAVKDGNDCMFAVKVLPEQKKSKEYEEFRKHMKQEVTAYGWLKDLQGTVVPKFYRCGRFHRNRFCLILEAFDGDTIQPGQLEQHQKIAIVEALKKIHSKGILHGDIRRANILVAKDTDRICFVDFGYSSKCKKPVKFEEEMQKLQSLLQMSKKLKLDPLVQAGTSQQ